MRELTFPLKEGDRIVYSTYIHWVDRKCTNHLVGRLSRISNPPNNSGWVIEYFEDCLKKLSQLSYFTDIPGCDPSKGKLVFIYKNRTPVFVDQRVINRRRPDLPKVLKRLNMKCLIVEEYIDKTNGICTDNRFFTSHNEDEPYFWHYYLHYYLQPEGYKLTEEEFIKRNGGKAYSDEGICRVSETLQNPSWWDLY